MSDSVIYVDRFEIQDGKLAELRQYDTDLAALAKDQAPGVLSFHYYADDAGQRGTALIVFADAEALDHYLEIAGPRFQRGVELVRSTEIELLGRPSRQAAQVTTVYGGRVMPEIVGFDR
ncbi:MAG: hypothetical protein M3O70_26275 [Actinomycetota bacterium]|nr:hypothetical protein [Actinomycetota bacterium]